MYKNIDKTEFIEAFRQYGREDNFSIEAREEMFNYYENLEQDLGQEIKLDVIAMCMEFNEYEDENEAIEELIDDETIVEIKKDVREEAETEEEARDEIQNKLIEELKERHEAIELSKGILVKVE